MHSFKLNDPKTYTKRAPNKVEVRKPSGWKQVDPELEIIRGYIQESGMSADDIAMNATEKGHSITGATIRNWMAKKVYKPQNYSMHAVMIGMGYIDLGFIARWRKG